MNWQPGRRSFLSTLSAAGLGFLGSGKLNALGAKGATHNTEAKMVKKVDGDPIVPIKSGFGSTGDVYAELESCRCQILRHQQRHGWIVDEA